MEAAFASFAEAMAQRWLPKGGSLVMVFAPRPGRLSAASLRETLSKLRASAASPRVRYLILDAGFGFLGGALVREARQVASLSFSVDASDIEGELQAAADGTTQTPPERVRSIIALSALNTSRKRYVEAVTLAAQALPLAAEVGPAEESLAWLSMGNTIYQMEEYETARNAYVNSVNLALDHGLDVLAASALTQLGHAHFCEGDYEAAIECYRTAQLYQARLGNLFGACHALLWLGEAHRARKEFKEAQEALQIALGAYASLGAPYADAAKEGKIEAEQRLARVYRESKQAREADAAEVRARELGGRGLITDKP
jgi:tetratricopeptide (TPR) repeat protein